MVDKGQVHWLQGKARELRERALGTADRTRRKQFLLIATEYQKLARLEDGGVAREPNAVAMRSSTPKAGGVTRLRFAPGRVLDVNSDDVATGTLARYSRALRRQGVIDLAIWAVLALTAFAILLIPGDQTTHGLQTLFDLFTD